MARLGVWRTVPPAALTGPSLADAVVGAAADAPPRVRLDLDGRERSTSLLDRLAVERCDGAPVSGWLEPVAAALDRRVVPCPVFFRDDDAGWDDDALWDLLGEFAATGVTIDVAAIPTAVGLRSARGLRARVADGVARVHQHGWSHTNHEPTGRKCEFGPGRSAATQAADVIAGRERLEARLGPIDPVFTPPWNRCTAATADAALAAGHGSCRGTTAPARVPGRAGRGGGDARLVERGRAERTEPRRGDRRVRPAHGGPIEHHAPPCGDQRAGPPHLHGTAGPRRRRPGGEPTTVARPRGPALCSQHKSPGTVL